VLRGLDLRLAADPLRARALQRWLPSALPLPRLEMVREALAQPEGAALAVPLMQGLRSRYLIEQQTS
jgi:hypothetical protein